MIRALLLNGEKVLSKLLKSPENERFYVRNKIRRLTNNKRAYNYVTIE